MANTPTTNLGLKKPANGDGGWDVPTNANWDQLDAFFGNTAPYLSRVVAKLDATAQQANITSTVLYAVPATGAGTYRISSYLTLTQSASTSSTLPNSNVQWIDETGGSSNIPITGTYGGNGVGGNSLANGATSPVNATFSAKASTNISVSTTNYASVGATPMQYSVHIKLEYLGT